MSKIKARMWQCIEYKSAAIEQFRKGDVLQRTIDDVASEAANAAEMKAAASGNPLILVQVQLASELRKLEALYSQHQRTQHRLRDRLKWLNGADERLAKAEKSYAENISLRDKSTRIITEKGKEKIKLELFVADGVLYEKDSEKIRNHLLSGIKEVTRNSSAKVKFGKYRGFDIFIKRVSGLASQDGFRLILKGESDKEYSPSNFAYTFEDKLSLSGMFTRIDNFLAKGFDEEISAQRERAQQEKAEVETINAALGKEFPQKGELDLVRDNHAAVIRELQRMQEDDNYISTWQPKTVEHEAPAPAEQDACILEPQTPVYMGEKSQTASSLATQFDNVFVGAIPPCGTDNNTLGQQLRS